MKTLRIALFPLLSGLLACQAPKQLLLADAAKLPPLAKPSALSSDQHARLGKLSLPFIQNQGQVDERVAFYAQTLGATLFVTRAGELVYRLPDASKQGNAGESAGWSVVETLVGAHPVPQGEGVAASKVSYFTPATGQEGKHASTYDALRFGEVYPGVELALKAYGHNVEKLFTVRPGADAGKIGMRLQGTESLRVDEQGRLVARTGLGEVAFSRPVAYQEIGGERRAVEVAYRTDADGKGYEFALGEYDRGRDLVIDPVLQSTYLGGTQVNWAAHRDFLIHPTSGNVYIAGNTTSTDFPGVTGGAQATLGGKYDTFIASISADLTQVEQVSYLGGGGNDYAHAIAVHPMSGQIYMAGYTEGGLPGTAGALQASISRDNKDAFLARFNMDLKTLVKATYLGANYHYEEIQDIVIHPATGAIFVTGYTDAGNCSNFYQFPGISGGFQGTDNGCGGNGFVARIAADLTQLEQASYLGGKDKWDMGVSIAIAPDGNSLYVLGTTESSNFPGVTGGAQEQPGAGRNAFVALISTDLTKLIQATYLGGKDEENANGLVIQPDTGDIYVGGYTKSNDFPGTVGGAQSAYAGSGDAFISLLSGDLKNLKQSTYLGMAFHDEGVGLMLHPDTGDIYISGKTDSFLFPGVTNGIQATTDGGGDAFVARFSGDLTQLFQSTYLGGNGSDVAGPPAIHPMTGDLYLYGNTKSTDFPGTASGVQSTLSGSEDIFIGKMDATLTQAPQSDTKPDPFTFIDKTNVELNTPITSNAITVKGIGAPSPIGITGGEYKIGAGEFTAAKGKVSLNDKVVVRLTSSSEFSTSKDATLTIGGVSDTFTVTTQAKPNPNNDTDPAQFHFTDQTGVEPGKTVNSNVITVTGINAAAPISITGGKYKIGAGSFTDQPGTVNNGQKVVVQASASKQYETTTGATLTIGTVSDTFSVTTKANPAIPNWNQVSAPVDLQPAVSPGSSYGQTLAASPDWLWVGAPQATSAGKRNRGAVYLWQRNAQNEWKEALSKPLSQGAAGDNFGAAIATTGQWSAIGAPKAALGGFLESGRVYLYKLQSGAWKAVQPALITPGFKPKERFGSALAMTNAWLAVGAPGQEAAGNTKNSNGAVYLFSFQKGQWTYQQTLAAPAKNGRFGVALALYGDRLVVGAPTEHRDISDSQGSGAVYAYRYLGGKWTRDTTFPSPVLNDYLNGQLGSAVALQANTLAVSAPEVSIADPNAIGKSYPHAGRVFLYAWDAAAGTWQLANSPFQESSENQTFEDRFGASLALANQGQLLLAGTPGADPARKDNSGRSYLYQLSGLGGTVKQQFDGDAKGQARGRAVALLPNAAFVGTQSGQVWLYQPK